MASAAEEAQSTQKRRKPRPSRGRGLRTTTGCLTCRTRRLKCDEIHPVCGHCSKSDRNCVYAQKLSLNDSDGTPSRSNSVSELNAWNDSQAPVNQQFHKSPVHDLPPSQNEHEVDGPPSRRKSTSNYNTRPTPQTSLNQRVQTSPVLSTASYRRFSGLSSTSPVAPAQPGFHSNADQAASPKDPVFSPITQCNSITPGRAPYEWWDLVAQDAAKSASSYQALKDSHSRWSFEPVDLNKPTATSQFMHNRHSSHDDIQNESTSSRGNGIGLNNENVTKEPWNTAEPTTLSTQELFYLKYYIDNVGPIFDLFDPNKTFTEHIPHLAMRNVGLLKSILAVSARFSSLQSSEIAHATTASDENRTHRSSFTDDNDAISTQFYFETLSYLSQAMQYPSYTRSQEILATAALISSYECFHVERSADWERHLKGVFWIQRSQETNGEREGLRGAVWWNWLRQDIWAALWQNRKPLTIWEPSKPVSILQGHEFASRATFLFARAVKYATQDYRDSSDLSQRISEGERHLQDLSEWYIVLPTTYRPLPAPKMESSASSSIFPSVWIHPPYHAAAMQHYYSAKILILLHRPSIGGVNAYHDSQRMLNEAVRMICGLAQSPTALEFPSAMIHFQALYVAGQCVRTSEQQDALVEIFERVLEANKFPTKSLLTDLQKVWATF